MAAVRVFDANSYNTVESPTEKDEMGRAMRTAVGMADEAG